MKRDRRWMRGVLMMLALPACMAGRDAVDRSPELVANTSARHVERPPASLPLAVPCNQMLAALSYPNTVFTSATAVDAGELVQPGQTLPAHCLVMGKMFERVSPIDGQTYAIGFEMRLPMSWNKRFFHQTNGGLDGTVVPAIGNTSGGGPLTSALGQGFAVISSDAGHTAQQVPTFGIDPQARLDYGYEAVGKLTPMAKAVIETAYGQRPAYSYIGGCSNGGRHAMVAAARYADDYDGYLVGSPGFNLPRAAVASMYGAQQYAPLSAGGVIADGPFAGLPDLSTAFTFAERQLVASRVLARCDGLDGVVDGLVQRTSACQARFSLEDDVPTCPGARDGTCLTPAQKIAIGNIFAGARTSSGVRIYSGFPFDSGLTASDIPFWEFISPLVLDPGAVGFVFGTPPQSPATFIPPLFTLASNVDDLFASIFATTPVYTQSGESFATPPALNDFGKKGRRMVLYQGVSDPIFSPEDTVHWFEGLDQSPRAQEAARLFLVPGMGHCAGGPATDQFDLLTPLVRWVEEGEPPRRVTAQVRSASNPGGANPDVPPGWSADRTRPLCPFPAVAVYTGGDAESADSFDCR